MEPAHQIIPEFRIYNRYQELERREREKKEQAWEKELLLAMNASDPLGQRRQQAADDDLNKNLHTCRSCPKLDTQNPKPKTSRLKKPKSCESESFNPSWDTRTSELTTAVETTPPQHRLDADQKLLGQCVSCSRSRKDDLNRTVETRSDISTCDIDKKLQQLDFIDRTPSPQEKKTNLVDKK